jgi:archaellum biogenesis protein FlaJ (TadC family)
MEPPPMSFREKSAWISFVTILLVFIPFFWNSYRQWQGAVTGHEGVSTAFGLLLAFVVLEIVLHVIVAIRAPKEAQSPRDEREQLIDLRATRVAFYVLLVGAFAAVGMVHLTRSAWAIQQIVLLAIVLAELVRFGGQILLFRRDA